VWKTGEPPGRAGIFNELSRTVAGSLSSFPETEHKVVTEATRHTGASDGLVFGPRLIEH
jgi:hypothetical protein